MSYIALNQILPLIEDPHRSFGKYMNFLLALRERRDSVLSLSSLPIEMTVDATTICPLSCHFCSTGQKTNPRSGQILQPEIHEALLKEVGDTVFTVNYFSTGEPLLNKNLPQLLQCAANHEIFYVISTNLSLPLSDEAVDELLTSGAGILSVSLDGATRAQYEKYRVGGDFALVVKNLKTLIQRKKDLGLTYPIIQWRYLVFDHNYPELEDAMRLAHEIDVDYFEHYPGGAPVEENESGVQKYRGKLPPNDFESSVTRKMQARQDTVLRRFLYERPRYWHMPQELFTRPSKCDWHYFSPMIYPDGGVAPCCMSEKLSDDFANVNKHPHAREQTFENLWNSYDFLMSRAMFARGQSHTSLCSRCPIPNSQYQQFVFTVQAILRNAPTWVLAILAAQPDRFFYRMDQAQSPKEVGALFSEQFHSMLPTLVPEAVDDMMATGQQYLKSGQWEAGSRWAQALETTKSHQKTV